MDGPEIGSTFLGNVTEYFSNVQFSFDGHPNAIARFSNGSFGFSAGRNLLLHFDGCVIARKHSGLVLSTGDAEAAGPCTQTGRASHAGNVNGRVDGYDFGSPGASGDAAAINISFKAARVGLAVRTPSPPAVIHRGPSRS